MKEQYLTDTKNKMSDSLNSYQRNISSVRAGRATPDLLNQIKIEAYNDFLPINQVATVSVQDNGLLIVQVWDKTNVAATEKAIMSSNLGLNPAAEGNMIRVPIPKLSEERRNELVKICASYAEQAKISVRNVRRLIIDQVKTEQKNSNISEDEMHDIIGEMQDITNDYTGKIDNILSSKKDEIMAI